MLLRLIPLLTLLAACSPKATGQNSQIASKVDTTKHRPIADILSAHTDAWMKIPGVTGTGETEKNGKPAVMIFVDSLTHTLRSQLPAEVEGYPVVIEPTGTINALPTK